MQRPPVQGIPEQQSLALVQTCPYWAQPPPASGGTGGALSGVPESTGGGGGVLPHVPRLEPGGAMHGSPGQQSAEVVQVPPLPAQTPPQTNGGKLLPAVNDGFGTQGMPQQSALVAQAWPEREPPS